VAKDLAKETVVGASILMDKSDDAPEELRRKVTSPGGTTEAALKSFDKNGFGDLVEKALKAADDRSRA
jgi:pyrroline-5-carboxylate reductase